MGVAAFRALGEGLGGEAAVAVGARFQRGLGGCVIASLGARLKCLEAFLVLQANAGSLDSAVDSLRESTTLLGMTVYGGFSFCGILASHPFARNDKEWGTLFIWVVWICSLVGRLRSTSGCPRRL
jgi:hypothetical protein